jgi:DNA-binding SARP family transcriptional activator
MNGRVTLIARIRAGLTVVGLLLALLLLTDKRPRLPSLPRSLSEPVAIADAQGLVVFVAWVAALALLVAFVLLSTRALLRRSPPQAPNVLTRERHRRPRLLRVALPPRNALARPYVLTLAPSHQRQPVSPQVQTDAAAIALPRPERDESRKQEPRPAIKLLGPITIDGLPRKGRGLRTDCRLFLVYLALHPNGANRNQLVAALWPDLPDQRARQRLYQAAADARARLGDSFIADSDRYRLDREQIEVDVDALERLLRDASASPDQGTERTTLEDAFGLVRGAPLAGLDAPWADGEARRLHAIAVDLCERLGHARLAAGDPAGALAVAEAGIQLDQLDEDLWRLAMEAEGALGLRDAVGKRYKTLCNLLDERLGLEPQRETRNAYLQLLAQE